MKKKILILCTGNSCRSQMAHGYFEKFHSKDYDIYSAGVETHGLNPFAVKVMKEDGQDISGYTSNHINQYLDIGLDLVISVCDHAASSCPVFPGHVKKVHVPFDDPPSLAKKIDDEEKKLEPYRRVRDQIKNYVAEFSYPS